LNRNELERFIPPAIDISSIKYADLVKSLPPEPTTESSEDIIPSEENVDREVHEIIGGGHQRSSERIASKNSLKASTGNNATAAAGETVGNDDELEQADETNKKKEKNSVPKRSC
jgi:hypothetical protein